MKVLIVSGTFLPLTSSRLRMAPSGAAYIAGAARQAGHDVKIFDCYGTEHPEQMLRTTLTSFDPDVVGLSITYVTSHIIDPTAPFGARYFDMRPRIKAIADTVKGHSKAVIILGGPGFNYYARNWLAYLDLSYGVHGEGENVFPLILKRLASNAPIEDVAGVIVKKGTEISVQPRDWIKDLDSTAMPAYQLFDYQKYQDQQVSCAVFTKRGCAFGCTFCPHSSLEGSRYRLKSPQRIIAEIEYILSTTQSNKINFCDNSFNCPKPHAEAICREIIDQKLKIQWHSGAFKPLRMTAEFCRLLKRSGCAYVGLSIESASDTMLTRMNRGYAVDDVRRSLDNLHQTDIPVGLSIIFGAPGETPETIAETLAVVDEYPWVQSIWVNIGLFLWTHHQKILEDARKDGQLKDDKELFNGGYYISPQLPKAYMIDLIDALKQKPKYTVQVNKPYHDYKVY